MEKKKTWTKITKQMVDDMSAPKRKSGREDLTK